MKYKRPSLLGSLAMTVFIVVGLVGLITHAPANLFAQAADATASAGALLDAAASAVVPDAPAAPAPAPGLGLGEIITAAVALISGLFGIWSHKQKKTAQKVSETLVLGIEAASKIPALAEREKLLKAKIHSVAERNGVQPLLHEIVKRVT